MEYYSLGDSVVAYTTDRTVGRDKAALLRTLSQYAAVTDVVYPHQVHKDEIFRVTKDMLNLTETDRKALLEGKDSIISDVQGVVFGISTADCIPVIVYDPEHHCAAAIHAGWKGTVQRIVQKTLSAMQEAYGTVPQQCTAAIGPGISQDSFEVGEEVVDAFVSAGLIPADRAEQTMVKRMAPSPMYLAKAGNATAVEAPHIDLKEVNRQQLLAMGVNAGNIEVSPIDTFTDGRFFSARREQKGDVKCGRILSGFVLK